MNEWNGKRVLILGAARQGLALARYLTKQNAVVTLNDQRTVEALGPVYQEIRALPVRPVFGDHPLSLLEKTDLVAVSGGVPLDLSIVQEAQRRGIPLSNDSQIFLENVPCKVVGVTGSAGKTTTTTLLGRMAKAGAQPGRNIWVGGNIGLPLIDQLDEIRTDDMVILELSSFQLELMTLSPDISTVLNITPNHLDRHGTLEAYTAAKARILAYQTPDDIAVLNREDPGSWQLREMVRGQLVTFGKEPSREGLAAIFLQDGKVWLATGGFEMAVLDYQEIELRGEHNLQNVLAACATAWAAGFGSSAMRAGVDDFKGVAHRLELVRTWNGIRWYNDSIATAPERTLAAIRSFEEPLVLLLGGRDKNLPWDSLAEGIHSRVEKVIVFGEAAEKIKQAIGMPAGGQKPYKLEQRANLAQALQAAVEIAEPGDVVLLSPGGTSYDEFKDFEARGEYFRKWINQLT